MVCPSFIFIQLSLASFNKAIDSELNLKLFVRDHDVIIISCNPASFKFCGLISSVLSGHVAKSSGFISLASLFPLLNNSLFASCNCSPAIGIAVKE